MSKEAITASKASGEVVVERVAGTNPHVMVSFPSGRTFAFGPNPMPEIENEPTMHAAAAFELLNSVEKLLHASGGAILDEERQQAIENVEVIAHNVENYMGTLTKEEDALYVVPPVTAIDAAEDVEIRNYARSLTGDAHTKFISTVDGDMRLTLAFARDPLRSPYYHQTAMNRWRAHVEKSKAADLASIATRREGGDWARIYVGRVRNLVRSTPVKQR